MNRSTLSMRESALEHVDAIDDLEACTKQLLNHANTAFMETTPDVIVPIPIAYSESQETVTHALQQFANQSRPGNTPFWVALSINGAPDKTSQISELADTVAAFQAAHPELPLSYFTKTYERETFTIGKVRRELCGAASDAFLQLHPDFQNTDIALIFNDIDLVKLSPQYVSRLYETLRDGANFAQAPLRHGRSDGLYPNMDRVLFWHDLPSSISPAGRQSNANAVKLDDYFRAGGFNAADAISEDRFLHDRVLALHGSVPEIRRAIGAFAVVSPRREYAYMQNGISPWRAWDDGNFGMDDAYRGGKSEALRDIDPKTADALIAELVQEDGYYGRGRKPFDGVKWLLMRQALGKPERFAPADWTPTPDEAAALLSAESYLQRVKHIGSLLTAHR